MLIDQHMGLRIVDRCPISDQQRIDRESANPGTRTFADEESEIERESARAPTIVRLTLLATPPPYPVTEPPTAAYEF